MRREGLPPALLALGLVLFLLVAVFASAWLLGAQDSARERTARGVVSSSGLAPGVRPGPGWQEED